MRALLVTDIHGEAENLKKILESESYDIVLCGGDLSDANKFDDYRGNLKQVLETFDREGKMVKAVPGNMDPEEKCVRELKNYRMNLHRKIASFETFDVVGYGGGQTPFGTPFEPEGSDIENTLNHLYQRMNAGRKMAVIHHPPKDTELDVAQGDHVGLPEVRNLIEQNDFRLVLTGHIHESAGRDRLGDTEILNPGPVVDGNYGVADISEGKVETELRSL